MSAWRREAIRQLPECKRLIEETENPVALWIELAHRLDKAYDDNELSLIGRLYDYARWCWNSRSADVRTAVACGFYEHLPLNPDSRRDLPKKIDLQTFSELRSVFHYFLSEDEFVEFEREFFERRQPRERVSRERRREPPG